MLSRYGTSHHAQNLLNIDSEVDIRTMPSAMSISLNTETK